MLELRDLRMYKETGNAGLVRAWRCISKPTLRKDYVAMIRQEKTDFALKVVALLLFPYQKVSEADGATVLRPRSDRKTQKGGRNLNELRRHEQRDLSLATIHKAVRSATLCANCPVLRRSDRHCCACGSSGPGGSPSASKGQEQALRAAFAGGRVHLEGQKPGSRMNSASK